MQPDGLWLKTACRLDARPEKPQGTEFGEREKFVRIGRKKKSDLALRLFERETLCFEDPQIFGAGCDHAGKFLRLPCARFVKWPPIGEQKMPGKASVAQKCVH